MTSAADRKRWLDAAIDVAKMAGARADSWFFKRERLVVETKGPQDYVSAADRRTEELIVEELTQRFPDHAFLGEEGAKAKPSAGQPVWVIDPIDGTTNFLRGLPLWAVSIALVVDGEPEVGCIHLPRQDETFAASRGAGATLDNRAIAVANTADLSRALVAVGSSSRTKTRGVNEARAKLSEAGVEIRRLGSACVEQAYVACGRLDAYFELHLNSWDVAAGIVILRESGALTNDFLRGDWLHDGNPYLCAAPGVYEAVRALTGVG